MLFRSIISANLSTLSSVHHTKDFNAHVLLVVFSKMLATEFLLEAIIYISKNLSYNILCAFDRFMAEAVL